MSQGKPSPFLERVGGVLRVRDCRGRTERTDVFHGRRYILVKGKAHAGQMDAPQVAQLLIHPAVEGRVAPSTQNQVFNALGFLCRQVIRRDGLAGRRP